LLWQIFKEFTAATIAWFRRLLSDDKQFADDGAPVEDAGQPEQPVDVAIADNRGNPDLPHGAMRGDCLLFHSFLRGEGALTPRTDHGDPGSVAHRGPLVMLVRLGERAALQDLGGSERQHEHDSGSWAVDSADFFVFVM
jgi:hypothetical protein